ncbi:MAG: hypothetical protein IKR84_00995 [Oscillibacter sp.]|nr:hypothetical protein [Oscillibacter sp.]
MNLRNVILSYPAIRYRVDVSHFTPRHSTAFEWLILEVIRKAQERPDMADVPASDIFEGLFLISDAERLIKPCILSLYDHNAIAVDGIDDSTPLDKVPMKNLLLTEDGARMQRDGLLPGKAETTSVEMVYDPVAGTLLTDAKAAAYSAESPTGTPVLPSGCPEGAFSPGSVAFPESLIMAELQIAREEKRWNWMNPGTQIQSAAHSGAELLWKNVSRSFQAREGWECFLDGDGDGVIAAKVLDAMDFPLSGQYADAPDMTACRPGEDIERALDLISLDGLLAERMQTDTLFVVNRSHFTEEAPGRTSRKEKGLRAAIVDGAEQLSVSLSENRLTVFLPERILPAAAVYGSASGTVRVGKVTLSAPPVRKEAVLGLVSAGEDGRFFPLIEERVVEKYSASFPELLYLLPEIGQSERLAPSVKDAARRLDSPQARYDSLLSFDRGFERIHGGKLLAPKEYGEVLVDREDIAKRCGSVADMERVLSEYYEAPVVKEREDFFQAVVGAVMDAGCSPGGVEELWGLWECLRSLRKSAFQWVVRNRLYSRYYTPEVTEGLARKVSFSGETGIQGYTPIEDAFLALERTVRRVLEKLPEVSLPDACAPEQVLECVLAHREEVSDLHSEVRNWEDAVENLASRVRPLPETAQAAPQLLPAIRLMDGLKEALSNFFDDRAVKFQRVYVADTSALMNRPELIGTFDDGKALLILPVLVLQELDAKKNDPDEKFARMAREAIRQIELYRGREWLDNTRNSCPNLLSADLNPDRNDNKILSIAIKYAHKNAVLITDDRNLRNLAGSQRIESMSSGGYMSAKAHETDNGGAKKKKRKKR